MFKVVSGIDWDTGNRAKCQKHGVTSGQVEALFQGSVMVFPDPEHSLKETRYLGIGPTNDGRYILVAFTFRLRDGQQLIRPISARFMHAKEIKHYEAQRKDS